MEMLKVSDVKTKADVHRVFAQQCIFSGYNAGIATFILGLATLPYAFSKINRIFIEKEYKVLVGVCLSVGASYYSAIYVKNRCQRRVIKELEELNLGHLVEGIEV